MRATTPPPSEPRVPELFVEQLALGELDAERARAIRERLEAEPGGLERLARIDADNAATLDALPPGMLAAQIDGRAAAARAVDKRRAKPAVWVLWGTPLLTAAAAAMIIVTVGGQPTDHTSMLPTPTPYTGTERPKGGPSPHLIASVKRSGRAQHLNEGDTVEAGELVQVGYMSVGANFGAIVSIDGRGGVTWHLPAVGKGRAAALAPRGERWLADSYELDDAPSFERFFFVTSAKAFDVASVDEAARRLARDVPAAANGKLVLPKGLAHNALLLRKGPAKRNATGGATP